MVRGAEEQVASAQREGNNPQGGTPQSQRLAAQHTAELAQIAYQERLDQCAVTPPPDPPVAGTGAAIDADLAAEGAAVVIARRDGADGTGTGQSVGGEAEDATGQATDP